MSIALLNLCRPAQMPPTAKSVLMAIADRANDQGIAWPSIPGLVEATCFGRTAVIGAVHWLQERGLVSVRKESGKSNRFTVNEQEISALVSTSVSVAAVEPVRDTDPSTCRTGTADAPLPVREAHPYPSGRRTDPSARRTRTINNHQSTTKQPNARARTAGTHEPAGFAEFYAAYPRKEARVKAAIAFAKLNVDAELLRQMLAAISAQAQSDQWAKDGGKFVPHPATWLNSRRWEDQVQCGSSDESRPGWAIQAGFTNRFEAENAGCFERTAHQFANGMRRKEHA